MNGYGKKLLLGILFLALPGTGSAQNGRGIAGAVYTMTNDIVDNEVVIFHRSADGSLTSGGSFSTGGQGTGGSLGNQGGLVLSRGHRWLFAVNALSNTVSSFLVQENGLQLVDVVHSGGIQPVSVTSYNNLLYVLNAEGNGNITGFRVTPQGKLNLIPGSIQPLSQNGGTGAAEISFSPDGEVLVVTEKATNRILAYSVNKVGVATSPSVHASAGPTPFGFAFGLRGQFFVSEAGGGPSGSSVSSYRLAPDGNVALISPSVPSTETASCWMVVTANGRFAITSNTPSDSLSSFQIGFDGVIELRDGDGRTGETSPGGRPLDSALTGDSHFLYVLNSGNGGISGFRVESDGGLTPVPTGIGPGSLPPGSNGMAAQ